MRTVQNYIGERVIVATFKMKGKQEIARVTFTFPFLLKSTVAPGSDAGGILATKELAKEFAKTVSCRLTEQFALKQLRYWLEIAYTNYPDTEITLTCLPLTTLLKSVTTDQTRIMMKSMTTVRPMTPNGHAIAGWFSNRFAMNFITVFHHFKNKFVPEKIKPVIKA